MRLDGNLEDFTLPDILQLLAHTRKTGSLQLIAGDDERRGLVRLGSGAINGASSDLRRHALARRLVGAGLVCDDALTAAADDVRQGTTSLVRALLERSDASSDEVGRLAADQVTDAVCELLRWSTGTFSFLVGDPDTDGLELGLSADDLVAEGERRKHVWPTLTSNIPSPETVLRLAPSPEFDPSCTREEWALLALVDGSRSVSEIVALLGRSEFAVAGALSALVERGLLTSDTSGSGLADLQRRQDVIATLEGSSHQLQEPAPTWEPPHFAPKVAEQEPFVGFEEPAPVFTPEAPVQAPAFEVPQARSEVPTPVAYSYEQPMTEGSTALDPAHEIASRGLDSAVTKSLVLRLIAGVRDL